MRPKAALAATRPRLLERALFLYLRSALALKNGTNRVVFCTQNSSASTSAKKNKNKNKNKKKNNKSAGA